MRCIAFVLLDNVIGGILTFMTTVIRATDGGKFCFVAKSRSCYFSLTLLDTIDKSTT